MSTNAEIEVEDATEETEETRRRMHPEVQILNLLLRELDKLAAKRGMAAAERVARYAASVFTEHENQV